MENETCPACKTIWKVMVIATMGILMVMAWMKMGSEGGPPPATAIEEAKP